MCPRGMESGTKTEIVGKVVQTDCFTLAGVALKLPPRGEVFVQSHERGHCTCLADSVRKYPLAERGAKAPACRAVLGQFSCTWDGSADGLFPFCTCKRNAVGPRHSSAVVPCWLVTAGTEARSSFIDSPALKRKNPKPHQLGLSPCCEQTLFDSQETVCRSFCIL